MSVVAERSAPVDPEATRVSGRRFVAHIVDGVLFTILFVVVLMLVGTLPEGEATDALLVVVLVLMLTVGHVAYFVLSQRRRGRSPGKLLVRIRVVDERGDVPSTGALIKRTVPLLIEYIYILAWIGMMSSEYRQRFGDRWARTYVVDASG